jgi:hypothetical protein
MSIMFKKKLIALAMAATLPANSAFSENYNAENVITVEQGWDYADRAFFYFSPQGSPIIPYDFAKALEQPNSNELFLDPTHLKELGMIYWDDAKANPENLPIGLTVDTGRLPNQSYLGMNCSACHVTEIKVGDKVALVDGGVSHFDFWTFMGSLNASLLKTYSNPDKFDRFADRVAAGSYLVKDRAGIRRNLRQSVRHIEDWVARNHADIEPGPGRVDALNVILNQVTAEMLQIPSNAQPANAPVSYPFLWDAPYFDVVQYNGSVPNAGAGALGRNVGQVLGVFGQVDVAHSGTLPTGYNSSVNVTHLMGLEQRLETLKSPVWSDFADKGLLPDLESSLVSTGETIYEKNCSSCHSKFDRNNRGELAATKIKTFDLKTIGTDPEAALGFAAREVVTGPLKDRKIGVVIGDPFCEVSHGNAVLAHMVAAVILNNFSDDKHIIMESAKELVATSVHSRVSKLGASIRSLFGHSNKPEAKNLDYNSIINSLESKGLSANEIEEELAKMSDHKSILFDELVQDHIKYNGDNQTCMATVETAQYRARPLNGIWATGPYLHNGSVPTLMDLLSPPSDRPSTFKVGNGIFDPKNVGFKSAENDSNFVFDTSKKGNSNKGHTYGVNLTDSEKVALIEYLKSQ